MLPAYGASIWHANSSQSGNMRIQAFLLPIIGLVQIVVATAPTIWTWPYPWPIHYHDFISQQQYLGQAYMDVPPNGTSINETIMLLHGANFCGVTWEATARVLSSAGYRVIIPDQIGFCKSSKPINYQFSLHQLARNTNQILQSLNISSLTVLGHSMGGMIATRFALMYPEVTKRLVLVDPLGLEDWKAKGVPYQDVDTTYATSLAANFNTTKAYQLSTYYGGNWKPEYDVWVNMLVSIINLPGEGQRYSWDYSLVTDMLYTQPTIYELPLLKPPTLLVIGGKDNTAIGKAWAPDNVKPLLGHYDVLGRQAAAKIPNVTLVEFPELGHSPQVQDPDAFHAALMGWLQPKNGTLKRNN